MATIQDSTSGVAAAAAASARSGGTAAMLEGQQDRFLKLLVTQMRNQDPLNPLDNAQVTSQLAQISTVTGLEKLNETLLRLVDGFNSSQTLSAAGMIGRGVLTPGAGLALDGGNALFGLQLAEPADQVVVAIKDFTGQVIHTVELGPQPAGVHALNWNGDTDSGAVAADGRYSFAVGAFRGEQTLDAEALEFGRVDGVSPGAAGVELRLGGGRSAAMADVRQVF